jgi:hypothetical protein
MASDYKKSIERKILLQKSLFSQCCRLQVRLRKFKWNLNFKDNLQFVIKTQKWIWNWTNFDPPLNF